MLINSNNYIVIKSLSDLENHGCNQKGQARHVQLDRSPIQCPVTGSIILEKSAC